MLEGIDVSIYQGLVHWDRVLAAGVTFAYCKASEGVSIKDITFVRNVKEAAAAGVAVGAYHFFRPGAPIEDQVKRFRDVCGDLPLTLPPALDMETAHPDVVTKTISALMQIENTFSRKPIIYTYPNFIFELKTDAHPLIDWPLWLAHYNGKPGHPMAVPPWETWTIHQYSSSGRVDGIQVDVDRNLYAGTSEELQAMGLPSFPKVPIALHIQDVIRRDDDESTNAGPGVDGEPPA